MHFSRVAVFGVVFAANSAAIAQEAARPDGLSWSGIRPQISLANGNFTAQPVARLDLNAGSYFGQPEGLPNRFSSGSNVRRGRLGVRGTVLKDFAYNLTWEFAPSTPQGASNGGRWFEASIAYTGLDWARFQVGAWTLPHTLAYASSSSELLMLERPSITALATSIASGDTRIAAGGEIHNRRWYGAGFLTQGVLSTLHDDRQRGIVGRGAWLALDGTVKMQIGFNAAYQGNPGPNNSPSQRLRDYPELRLNSFRYLDTRSIPASASWAWGPELSGMIGRLHYAAEYQSVGIDADTGPQRNFDGWYLQVAYPLIGEPRRRSATNATWRRGRGGDLDFREHWGALEAAAGYSTVNLNDRATRGGRQEIWSAALNWYPTSLAKLTVQYQNGTIGLPGTDRDFQSVSFGMILSF